MTRVSRIAVPGLSASAKAVPCRLDLDQRSTQPASLSLPPASGTDAGMGLAGAALLTIGEVAGLLRACERTVRRYVRTGRLRKVPLPGRLVRISRDDLNAFLDGAD